MVYVDLAEDLSRAAVPVWAPCDEGWPGQDNREHGQVSGNRAAVHKRSPCDEDRKSCAEKWSDFKRPEPAKKGLAPQH